MVVGRSDTGRIIRFQVFYYLCDFPSGAKTWGFVPDTGEATLDIILVDCRGRFTVRYTPQSVGRVLHLSSGPDGVIRIADLVGQVRARYADRGQPSLLGGLSPSAEFDGFAAGDPCQLGSDSPVAWHVATLFGVSRSIRRSLLTVIRGGF